jgi:hypothetical protein
MSLLDIHNNTAYATVVYGSSSNNGALEMTFDVSAFRNSATQYTLYVTLYGSTSLTRMQLFLLLIGNEAAGYIEVTFWSYHLFIQAYHSGFYRLEVL